MFGDAFVVECACVKKQMRANHEFDDGKGGVGDRISVVCMCVRVTASRAHTHVDTYSHSLCVCVCVCVQGQA